MDDRDEWLEDMMNEYGERLTNLSYSYVKDWGKAEEVVQDVFVSCYRNYNIIPDLVSFKAWIYRLTINRSKDVLRSAFVKRVIVNNFIMRQITSVNLSPEQAFMQKDSETLLAEKVLSLPVKYREIIILYYYETLSIEEISDLLKMNKNTIKTRLNRGRIMLKDILEGTSLE